MENGKGVSGLGSGLGSRQQPRPPVILRTTLPACPALLLSWCHVVLLSLLSSSSSLLLFLLLLLLSLLLLPMALSLPVAIARCCPLPAVCCPTKCFVVPVARCKVCTAVWLFILASQQAAPAPTGTHWAPFK